MGFLAAVLVLRTRSVWAGVGVHAGVHIARLICAFTGIGAQGRFYWIGVGLVLLLVGLLLLRGQKRDRVVIDR